MAEDSFAVTTSSSDSDWYFSSKGLIFRWARVIGPESFLLYHFIKSQCPDRGLKGRTDWTDAPMILGLSREQIDLHIEKLKAVGLLQTEDNCLVIPDPDDIKTPTEKEREI